MNISIDYVQIMNNNSNIVKMNQEQLDILRKLSKKPNISQRELASDLGISLGKLNYVLNELKTKGLVKISNFKKNPNKIKYLYLLTPKGISEKTKLTVNFMKKKLREYDELKKEIENIVSQQYILEVSSPGLDRPLKSARDFLRNKNQH